MRTEADCRSIDVCRPCKIPLVHPQESASRLLDDNQFAAPVGVPAAGARLLLSGRHRTCGREDMDRLSHGHGCFFGRLALGLAALPRDLVPADAATSQLNRMRGPGRSSNISTGVDSRGQTCFGHSAIRMRARLKSPPAMPGGSFSRRTRIGAWRAEQAYRWRRV